MFARYLGSLVFSSAFAIFLYWALSFIEGSTFGACGTSIILVVIGLFCNPNPKRLKVVGFLVAAIIVPVSEFFLSDNPGDFFLFCIVLLVSTLYTAWVIYNATEESFNDVLFAGSLSAGSILIATTGEKYIVWGLLALVPLLAVYLHQRHLEKARSNSQAG